MLTDTKASLRWRSLKMKEWCDDVNTTTVMRTGTKESLSHELIFYCLKQWHTTSGNAPTTRHIRSHSIKGTLSEYYTFGFIIITYLFYEINKSIFVCLLHSENVIVTKIHTNCITQLKKRSCALLCRALLLFPCCWPTNITVVSQPKGHVICINIFLMIIYTFVDLNLHDLRSLITVIC